MATSSGIAGGCSLEGDSGSLVKRAPPFPVGLLALVQNFVTTESNPAYMRMYGWWVLLQSWGTMRFSDHRGLSPADISFEDGSLTGLFEEDEDHRHRQERVCEASEGGCEFIHLFAPVALSGWQIPERAGPVPEGLSPSSTGWSIPSASANCL